MSATYDGYHMMVENLDQAIEWLTSHKEAIKSTIGTTQEADLVALLDKTNLRVHPVRIGYKINTHLLDQISNQSGGSNVYVAPAEDLELKLAQFYEQIKEPLLVNLDLSFEGVTVSDLHPCKLPDLYRGQALHVFGRYSGSGTARVTLKGAMNAKAVEQSYRLRFKESRDHAFITKLWAKRRVGWLLDQIRLNGSDPELVGEVRQLGARFDILTPYNSRLILGDERTRPQSVVSSGVLKRLPTGRAVDSLMTTMPKEKSGRAAFTTSVQIQSYEDALTVDEEVSGVKKECLEPNPRRIKNFLNQFIQRGKLMDDPNPKMLALIIMLHNYYPQVYNALEGNLDDLNLICDSMSLSSPEEAKTGLAATIARITDLPQTHIAADDPESTEPISFSASNSEHYADVRGLFQVLKRFKTAFHDHFIEESKDTILRYL